MMTDYKITLHFSFEKKANCFECPGFVGGICFFTGSVVDMESAGAMEDCPLEKEK
jgi:hypothetical protein